MAMTYTICCGARTSRCTRPRRITPTTSSTRAGSIATRCAGPPWLGGSALRRLTVLGDFRRALESEEFVLHFQPLIDVDGSHVRGAEGLVRWQHPELGLLPAGDFIPI